MRLLSCKSAEQGVVIVRKRGVVIARGPVGGMALLVGSLIVADEVIVNEADVVAVRDWQRRREEQAAKDYVGPKVKHDLLGRYAGAWQ
jgi:hypothetical protein